MQQQRHDTTVLYQRELALEPELAFSREQSDSFDIRFLRPLVLLLFFFSLLNLRSAHYH